MISKEFLDNFFGGFSVRPVRILGAYSRSVMNVSTASGSISTGIRPQFLAGGGSKWIGYMLPPELDAPILKYNLGSSLLPLFLSHIDLMNPVVKHAVLDLQMELESVSFWSAMCQFQAPLISLFWNSSRGWFLIRGPLEFRQHVCWWLKSFTTNVRKPCNWWN